MIFIFSLILGSLILEFIWDIKKHHVSTQTVLLIFCFMCIESWFVEPLIHHQTLAIKITIITWIILLLFFRRILLPKA